MEDVDPLHLRFVEVVVDDKTSETSGQRLHPLSDGVLASVLSPVNLVLLSPVIISVGLIDVLIRSLFLSILVLPVLLLGDGLALRLDLLFRRVLHDERGQLVT